MFVNIPVFFGVAAVVIMTPGQDTALTIRNTLLGGRGGGVGTAAGVAAGQATWTLATSLGVVALLLASPPVFAVIRIAGAAYLMFLGGQALWHAIRGTGTARVSGGGALRRLGGRHAFRQGVISNLGNPKMAVFFASLLPQFVETPSFESLSLLGMTFCLMTLGWLTLLAFVVARAGDVLGVPTRRRALEGATGTALIGLGLYVMAESVTA
jgi:threonine/homoserine/homoserine lactone efflux protein